jgi:hypothetical protein
MLKDGRIPAFALKLYPCTDSLFGHIAQLRSRLGAATQLSVLVSDTLAVSLFPSQIQAQRPDFLRHCDRMQKRLVPILFTVFHFFEHLRERRLKRLRQGGPDDDDWAIDHVEKSVISMYDDATLLEMHRTFFWVIEALHRRLHPSLIVSTTSMPDLRPKLVLWAILCIGGVQVAHDLLHIPDRKARGRAIEPWCQSMVCIAVPQETTTTSSSTITTTTLQRAESGTQESALNKTRQLLKRLTVASNGDKAPQSVGTSSHKTPLPLVSQSVHRCHLWR